MKHVHESWHRHTVAQFFTSMMQGIFKLVEYKKIMKREITHK